MQKARNKIRLDAQCNTNEEFLGKAQLQAALLIAFRNQRGVLKKTNGNSSSGGDFTVSELDSKVVPENTKVFSEQGS